MDAHWRTESGEKNRGRKGYVNAVLALEKNVFRYWIFLFLIFNFSVSSEVVCVGVYVCAEVDREKFVHVDLEDNVLKACARVPTPNFFWTKRPRQTFIFRCSVDIISPRGLTATPINVIEERDTCMFDPRPHSFPDTHRDRRRRPTGKRITLSPGIALLRLPARILCIKDLY